LIIHHYTSSTRNVHANRKERLTSSQQNRSRIVVIVARAALVTAAPCVCSTIAKSWSWKRSSKSSVTTWSRWRSLNKRSVHSSVRQLCFVLIFVSQCCDCIALLVQCDFR